MPALLVGATDSRHYSELARNIYRFTPTELGPGDLSRIHGINERLSLSNYFRAVEFYGRLMQASAH